MTDDVRATVRKMVLARATDGYTVLPGVFFADDADLARAEGVRPVTVPRDSSARRRFVRDWVRKNQRAVAAGLSGMTLLLPMAAAAQATQELVALSDVEGVESFRVLADGQVEVTLSGGRTTTLPAGAVTTGAGGEVMVAAATGEAIAAAAASASAGLGLGLGQIAAGGLALGAAAAVASDSDSDGGGGAAEPETAYVIDGYLAGARVFHDADDSGTWDEGEPYDFTEDDGSFDPSIFGADMVLTSTGGIDISTGAPFTGTLTAPAGSTVVTPLTTLVQSLVEATADDDEPLDAAAAEEVIKTKLGLDADADLTTLDPVEAAEAGDTAPMKKAAQVANVLALAEQNGGDSAAVARELAQALNDPEGAENPLQDSESIKAALEAGGVSAETSQDIADDAKTANDTVDEAEDLAAIEDEQAKVAGETTALRPTLDPVDTEIDAAEAAAGVTFTGTGRAGTDITVAFGGETASATVDAEGDWSVTFAAEDLPADGVHEVAVTATTEVETADGTTVVTSAPRTADVTLDATVPDAPVIDTVAGDDVIDATEAGSLTISGTAEAGATVTVSGDGIADLTATAGADGAWSVTADLSGASDGALTLSATATDAVGNSSAPATRAVTVNIAPPAAPVIDTVAGDDVIDPTEAGSVTISGTAEAGATVTLSSTLFAGDITVTADETGAWTTEALDLSGAAVETYTISAVANDGLQDSAAATTEVEVTDQTGPAITLEGGEQDGDVVVFDAQEFDEGGNLVERENTVDGAVSNVDAGTEVSVTIGEETYTGQTGANGVFSIAIPPEDIEALDGSAAAVPVTIAAGGASLTLNLLVNSEIDGQTIFAHGGRVIRPEVDAESGTENFEASIGETGTLSNGQFVVVLDMEHTAEESDRLSDFHYKALLYGADGQLAESFAFDGGPDETDLAALSSYVTVTADGLGVVQSNASLSGETIRQSADPAVTLYHIPAAQLAGALGSDGTNIDTSGIAAQTIALDDLGIDSDLADNVVLVAEEAAFPADGPAAVILVQEDVSTEEFTPQAGYLASVAANGTVTAREFGVELDEYDELVIDALRVDPATGDPITVLLSDPGDRAEDEYFTGFAYDLATGTFTDAVGMLEDSNDSFVADGQDAIVDGGGLSDFSDDTLSDDDSFFLGNLNGDEGELKITREGDTVTVAVDREAALDFFAGEPDLIEEGFDFDIFFGGNVEYDAAVTPSYGTHVQAPEAVETGAMNDRLDYASFWVDIDYAGIQNDSAETVELVSFGVTPETGNGSYGIGFGVPTDDGDFDFEGFAHLQGIDGAGTQTVVLESSQGFGGLETIYGFETGAGENADAILVDVDDYSIDGVGGDAIQKVATGQTLAVSDDTGLVIFEGAMEDFEDADVVQLINDSLTGMGEGDVLFVLSGDASGSSLAKVGFGADGDVAVRDSGTPDDESDDYADIDYIADFVGLTGDALSGFTADNFELLRNQAEV
ncbi:Ig-like domain-containing protein [Rhodovulum sp. YNF3179]|uniref:Ig-like domain-containing protein n=1 Tax=Rhodovulum sp. YNF3179 TaxID=3425127 RepID=UPI003D353242